MEAIEREEANGAIIRSKARWTEAGERNTKYFLNLEKRIAINKSIEKLSGSNDNLINNTKDILM